MPLIYFNRTRPFQNFAISSNDSLGYKVAVVNIIFYSYIKCPFCLESVPEYMKYVILSISYNFQIDV